MLPFFSLTLAALIATSSPGAQVRQPPQHGHYISLCLQAINPQSERAIIEAIAACQCHFETMPASGFVDEAQFNQGMETCKAEGYKRTVEFTQKYTRRFEMEQDRLVKENKLDATNGVVLPAIPPVVNKVIVEKN